MHPIGDLQIEYSLVSRGPEDGDLPGARRAGHRVTAYGVLSRGLLTGARPGGAGRFRAHLPRFTGENGERTGALVDALAQLARRAGVTPAQLAIAWVRGQGGRSEGHDHSDAGRPHAAQLDDALAGLDVALSADEVAALEAAVPAAEVAGTRYAAPHDGRARQRAVSNPTDSARSQREDVAVRTEDRRISKPLASELMSTFRKRLRSTRYWIRQ